MRDCCEIGRVNSAGFLGGTETKGAYDFLVQRAHALLQEFDDGARLGAEVVVCGGFGRWDVLWRDVVLLGIGLVGGTVDGGGGGGVREGDGALRGGARCPALGARLALSPLGLGEGDGLGGAGNETESRCDFGHGGRVERADVELGGI